MQTTITEAMQSIHGRGFGPQGRVGMRAEELRTDSKDGDNINAGRAKEAGRREEGVGRQADGRS